MGYGGRVTGKSGRCCGRVERLEDGVEGCEEWEMVLKGRKSGRWC